MAINIVTPPTGGAPLSTDDYDAQNTLLQALLYSINKETRFLTEWDTTDEPSIKQGVYIQHGGSLYLVEDTDESISGSPSDGMVYVKITEAAGVLTASFVTSAVGYSWNDTYNGFYHADGTQLLPIFIRLSSSGTVWDKYILSFSNNRFDITGERYAVNSGVLIASQENEGSTDFVIKKPISAWIFLDYTSGVGYLSIYQNGAWQAIDSWTGADRWEYALQLNPGTYRLTISAGGTSDIYLYCSGVYGTITMNVNEIVT